MLAEWATHGKPSVLGIASGAVAGLVAITPAAGFVGPGSALILGAIAGVVCFWACTWLKNKLGYDDSLDVFGVHGVGGFVGTVLAGVFASEIFGGLQGDLAIAKQVGLQLMAAVLTVTYTGLVTFGLARVVDVSIGLRVDDLGEEQGLDLFEHGESGYNL
jgi:Amt family ammonium transporter